VSDYADECGYLRCGIIIVLAVIVFFLHGCSSAPQPEGVYSLDRWVVQGWTDEDMVRVLGEGQPNPDIADRQQRREIARQAAVLTARGRVLEVFSLDQTERPYDVSCALLREELLQVSVHGKLVRIEYDENDNCEVVLEFRMTGLRKKVRKFRRKSGIID
jgi:hypothetical protein